MSDWKSLLMKALNVREREGWPLLVLTAHWFLNGLCIVFFFTVANTLFLRDFSTESLPYVYVAAAAVSTLIGVIYSKFESSVSKTVLLQGTLAFVLASLFILWGVSVFTGSRWVSASLMIWKEVVWILLSIEVWAIAGLVFNVRQAKRLFGQIEVGQILAEILGGLSVPLLLAFLEVENLLLIAVGALCLSFMLLTHATRVFRASFTVEEEDHVDDGSRDIRDVLRTRYVMLLFGVSVVSVLCYYGVDLVFYSQVESRFPEEKQLAGFFGVFFAVSGTLSLFSTGLFSGRLLMRFGLGAGLLAVPIVDLFGVTFATTFGLFTVTVGLFFWLVVGTKLFDEVLRSGYEMPSFRILYQPLSPSVRTGVQTIRESIIEPAAATVAGLLLLLLTVVFNVTNWHLCSLLIGGVLLWLFLCVMLRRGYTQVLTEALAKRRVGRGSLSISDASSVAVLQTGLRSQSAGEVLFCLSMLEDLDHKSLNHMLIEALQHSAEEVRLHALNRLEELHVVEAAGAVAELEAREQVDHVRGRCLQTLCALAEHDAFEKAFSSLQHPRREVRKGAMVGLLRSGGIDGVLAAGEVLNQLLGSDEVEDRIFAAEVLGEVQIGTFFRPLIKLLSDAVLRVRPAALAAAAKLRHPRLLPLIFENLAIRQLRNEASDAVVAYGVESMPEITRRFAGGQDERILLRLIRIAASIGGEAAIDLLVQYLSHPSAKIRSAVMLGLLKCRYQASGSQAAVVREQILAELDNATWVLAAMCKFEQDEAGSFVTEALRAEFRRARENVLCLLAFRYPAESILRVRANLASQASDQRAAALELLDNVISQEFKSSVIPLFDELASEQLLGRLASQFPQPSLAAREWLPVIIARDDLASWTRICTLYETGRLVMHEASDTVGEALNDVHPAVRETAVWVMGRLDPPELHTRLEPFRADRSAAVARIARAVLDGHVSPDLGTSRKTPAAAVSKRDDTGSSPGLSRPQEINTDMLLTIEKVLILKSVGIFSEIPEDDLVEVATALEEMRFRTGAPIIRKGDIGTSLYIIVFGKVRVHDGDKTVARLERRDIFGELSALDPEPRSASITAEEDTLLLKLEGRILCEVMSDHPGVAVGIIRILCRRIRTLLHSE